MHEIWYIGGDKERIDSLNAILGNRYQIKSSGDVRSCQFDNCALVVVEYGQNPARSADVVARVRRQLHFRNIPVLICVERSHEERAVSQFRDCVAGLLLSPFDTTDVKSLIGRIGLPDCVDESSEKLLTSLSAVITRVVSEIAGSKVVQVDSYLKSDYCLQGDICGVMLIRGHFEGSVAIGMTRLLARKLAAQLAGCEEVDLNDEDLADGVGEVINQITGNLRSILWELGHHIEIHLPETFIKDPPPIKHQPSQPHHVIVLECENELLALQWCLTAVDEQTQADDVCLSFADH